MKVICGLGNPGIEYSNTRHNLGFLFIDYIANFLSKQGYRVDFTNKWNAEIALIPYNDFKLILLKPLTYMNLSGRSLIQVKNFYKIDNLQDIIVIHDDIELEFAKVKFKIGGSSAGHNGLKSIDNTIGKNYKRVRVGIGKENDVSNFVLSKFKNNEITELEIAFAHIADNLELLFEDDISKFNTKISNLLKK